MLIKLSKALALSAAGLFLWSADALLLTDQGAAYAQASDDKEAKTRKTPAMREKVYKRLAEAQELVESGDTNGAVSVLTELKGMRDLNAYEVAQVWSFFGYIYYSAENYPESI